MSVDISQNGMQWVASIDYSQLRIDAKNVDDILKELGQTGIDTTKIDESVKRGMKQQTEALEAIAAAQKQTDASRVQSSQEANAQIVNDQKQSLAEVVEATKTGLKQITSGSTSVIFPENFVEKSKAEVTGIVDYSKKQMQELFDYSQNNGNFFTNASTPNAPKPQQSEQSQLSTALSESVVKMIDQAKQALSEMDPVMQEYLNELVELQMQSSKVAQAQKELSAAFKEGKVTEQQFASSQESLVAQHQQIKDSINSVNQRQKEYNALNNVTETSVNEMKARLAALRTEWDELSESEREAAAGQDIGKQIGELTKSIAALDPAKVEQLKGAVAELRELKNQLANGNLSGDALEKATKRAAELEKGISNVNKQVKLQSSNTAGIDALADGVQGLIGGFTAFQGLLGLTNQDETEFNEIIAKSTSAMALLNGVQQIAAVVNKDSAVNLYLRNALQKESVVQTTEQAAASTANAAAVGAEAVATEGATVAQTELNAAMLANPVGILLGLVAALVAAIYLFSQNAKAAEDRQKAINQQMRDFHDLIREIAPLYRSLYDDRTADAERALAIAQAEGRSVEETYGLQQKVNQSKKEAVVSELAFLGITAQNTKELRNQVDYQRAILESRINNSKSKTKTGSKEDQEDAQKELDDAQKSYDKLNSLEKEYFDTDTQMQSAAAARQKEIRDNAYKSTVAYWQARVELAKKGSKEEFEAQKGLAAAQLRETLASPNLTSGERAKAQADYTKAIEEANKNYSLSQIENQKSATNAALQLAKEGSIEEYNYKKRLLDLSTKEEIIQAEGNADKISEINAKNQREKLDLLRQYNTQQLKEAREFAVAQAKINVQESQPNTESNLAWVKELNDQEALKSIGEAVAGTAGIDPEAIKEAASLSMEEVLAFEAKVATVNETLAKKIHLLYASALKANKDADDDFVAYIIKNQAKTITATADVQIASLENKLRGTKFLTASQKLNIEIDIDNRKLVEANQQLTAFVATVSKTYPDMSTGLKAYVAGLNSGTGSIAELNDPSSQISQLLDKVPKLKDEFVKWAKSIPELKSKLDELEKSKFSATMNGIGEKMALVGQSLSSLGSSVSELNAGLGDSLSTMGQLASAGANLAKGIASKDPISIISGSISVVTSVFGIFSAAKASAIKAAKELKAWQDGLITGQVEYNQYLRQQLDTQTAINAATQKEFQIRQNSLAMSKQQAQQDLETLKTQLLLNGQQITGEHTEKYGGFLGVGKKTRVVQDLASLNLSGMSNAEIANYLKSLELQGKLTDETKKWVDAYLSVYNEIGDINDALDDTIEQMTEAFSGTTADAIADSIVQGLKDGKRSFEDFGSDIEGILQNSILAGIKDELLNGAIKDIWNQYKQLAESGNGLNQSAVDNLRSQLQNAVTQASKEYDQFSQWLDVSALSSSSNTMTATIQRSLTEQTGDILTGLYRNNNDLIRQQLKVGQDNLRYMQLIEQHTAASLAQLQQFLPFLVQLPTIADNTQGSTKGIRDIFDKI